MNRFLTLTACFCSLFSFLSVIWILLPAPFYSIWLYSVAVSEWSLWLGVVALGGVICALIVCVFYQSNAAAVGSIIIGAVAFLISLYPLFTALQTADEQGVSLSFTQYFSAVTTNKSNSRFQTHVFKKDGETLLKMDVYAPPETVVSNGAGIIVVHGGSWRAGERNDFPQWNSWLAENGYTVFDIDYRLAPQPNYLAAIGDVKCAILQIKKRAAEFKIAPEKLVLLGRSAGAQLALTAAYTANDARLPASCEENELDQTDESVRAVVSFYAPTDLLWAYDNPANRRVINGAQTLADFLGGNPHESDEIRSRFALASPVANAGASSPPTFLMHGAYDQLVRPENLELLAEKLKLHNVAHETLVIPYGQHGFDYNFNGWASQIAKPLMFDFLDRNTR